MKKIACLALVTLFVAACASKPILNPNDKYQQAGHEGSERDIKRCEKAADRQLKKTQDRRVLRTALKGAALGGVIGGVAGSRGHTGLIGGAAMGAAGGAVGGAAVGAFSTPEEARRGLINYCLQQKGYSIAGWE